MNPKKYLLMALLLALYSATFAQQESLLDSLRRTQDKDKRIGILNIIGRNYQIQRAYKKSLRYLHEAHVLQQKQNVPQNQQTHTLKAIAAAHSQLKNYDSANFYLEKLFVIRKEQKENKAAAEVLSEMSLLYQQSQQYEKSLEKSLEQAQILETIAHNEALIAVYNNIGFLHSQTNNQNKSIEYYKKAISLGEKLAKNEKNIHKKAIILTNTGVAHANTNDYKSARDSYQEALNLVEPLKNPAYIADVKNYLAANQYLSGNNKQALEEAQEALKLAQDISNEELMATSYRIMSEIYKQEGDFRESQRCDQEYQKLREKANERARKAQEELLQIEIDIEKKEAELSKILNDKERSESQLRESELQKEKLQQEKLASQARADAAMAESKNAILEKERSQQQIALLESKAAQEEQRRFAEAQKQEAENQRREAEKQRILAEKSNIEAQSRQKELLAAQEREAAQAQQLKQEKAIRQYGVIVLILGALLLIFILAAFIASRRAAQKLRQQNAQIMQQKEEIAAQNEELYQNQEEIIAQKEFIGKQKEELEESNNKLTSSIRYAQTIQDAILPSHERLTSSFEDYFIIYKPKDIVAGDFYWIEDIGQNQLVAAVLDCTGHGVPGAFMSMIGYALMNEIVNTKRIIRPAAILEKLHHDVQKALRQEESNNKDGMDVCITLIEKQQNSNTVYFAGAKLPLFYIQNHKMYEIAGSRKAIGGTQNPNKYFEEVRLELPKGTTIYLGSDGIIDQSNFERKKFGKAKLQEILVANAEKPLQKQKQALEYALETHQGKAEQRDDITFIGLKIS